jgi:hypothetical protein
MSTAARSFRGLVLLMLVLGAPVVTTARVEAQNWHTIRSARQAWGEKEADRSNPLEVQVEYAVGKLTLAPGPSSLLYQMELRYDQSQYVPVTEYDREAGKLRLGVQSRDRNGKRNINVSDEAWASVALAPDVPLGLQLRFGAGEADLNLGGLSLRTVDISTGASETTIAFKEPNRIPAEHVQIRAGAAELRVSGLGNARAETIDFAGGVGETVLDFSGEWSRNANVSLKMGIGSLTLRVPRELGVKLTRNSLLTSFDPAGLSKRGSAYYSDNWDSAARRLTIAVDAALGSIDVQWIN